MDSRSNAQVLAIGAGNVTVTNTASIDRLAKGKLAGGAQGFDTQAAPATAIQHGVTAIMKRLRRLPSRDATDEGGVSPAGGTQLRRGISIILLAAGIPSLGLAAPETAICAVEQAIACPPFAPCERNLPSAVNLPSLFRIDRPDGLVTSRLNHGEQRKSKISGEWGDDAVHVLHGIDEGKPWSIRVDLATGRFTLTSAQEEVGYVAFGTCSSRLIE